MATIKDIAKISGVSYPTVSHVLNRTRDVSPKTQKKVFDAINKLGYIPNGVARGLRRSRMNTIGVVFPFPVTSFFTTHCYGPIVDGIMVGAQSHKQTAMFYVAEHYPDIPESLQQYCDGRSDGLVVIGQRTNLPFVAALKARSYPFVCVTEAWEDSGVPYVDAMQSQLASGLLDHFVSLGHRRIAILPGREAEINVQQRLIGSNEGLDRHGLSREECPISFGNYDPQSGYDRTRDLFQDSKPGSRPTAILCFNDHLAWGALAALADLGLKCPEDVSVAGIDDSPPSVSSNPPLTSMRLPLHEIGEQAISVLIDVINGEPRDIAHRNIPGELIVRQSTAPPNS
jgi:DNA-binding LacI/PurR family transcriptional regulator